MKPVVQGQGLTLQYGKTHALRKVDLSIPAGCMVGLIGPDGVGKSSLLALISGARRLQQGELQVLGGDMRSQRHRRRVCPDIAYMPQGLGRNLYPTLSVEENLQFFARLFGHAQAERRRRIDELTAITGLKPFLQRPAGKLSGGMKQKLGLCCALIHDPLLLILDEPTTGVDPLSRSQFWQLINTIRAQRPQMSVLVATAYMDEAARFDHLLAMNNGSVLATGSPVELLQRTGAGTLENAFIALLPEQQRQGYQPVTIPPLVLDKQAGFAIEAHHLTMKFGDFIAVDNVSFQIRRGEIFGFLGSNGCGKSTTMKMLTGLLPARAGRAELFGHPLDPQDIATRKRVGYMSQAFSLYGELTVRQNLELHARLFHVPAADIPARVQEMSDRFGLQEVLEELPERLPLGIRQRLSLAVAMVHKPELLILDEPTSGVDPVARDNFWRLMIDLARHDGVTIFISTHFMNEAARCDRISLMHAGKVLLTDTPAAIVEQRGGDTLEQAFIDVLIDAGAGDRQSTLSQPSAGTATPNQPKAVRSPSFSMGRLFSYAWREALELVRDPLRLALSLVGTLVLMLFVGYGITLDVEDLNFAVLDNDQTVMSRDYVQNLSGSRYFNEQPPLTSYAELDRRMRSGELALALEIPAGFARRAERGEAVQIGAWIDGAMPLRAETISGYVQGMHLHWLGVQARAAGLEAAMTSPIRIETRYRYNPDVKSIVAMVPAVIPLLLLMIPALLTTLSVVREKELGSITNLYVTPVSRTEFLLGKQLPYIGLGVLNFFLLVAMALWLFKVPLTGSFLTLLFSATLFIMFSTGFGLLASVFTNSQIAAMLIAMLGTMLPAVQFAGMITPVSALEGVGRVIGEIHPVSHFLQINRGIFNKALTFADVQHEILAMALAVPVILALGIVLLKKQEA